MAGLSGNACRKGIAPVPLKLADEPGDEKRGVAFAAMVSAHANRADLDAPVEPHALASHGGKRAVDPNADVVTELMRARTERAGIRPAR